MTSGIKRALIVAGVLAVLYGAAQTAVLMKASTGNDKMREIAAAIQEGASAYLKRQYGTIAIVGVVLFALVAWRPAITFRPGWSEHAHGDRC